MLQYIVVGRFFKLRIMKPEEKAKELSIKLCSPLDVFKPNLASNNKAIICVNEIIKVLNNEDIEGYSQDLIYYWQEVIEEIAKL